MSSTKHSPGPWYVVGHNWHESSVYSNKTGERVCTMDTEDWGVTEENQEQLEDRQEANANLIATAPEMAEGIEQNQALLEMLCWLEEHQLTAAEIARAINSVMQRNAALIAKIKGAA